MAAIANIYVVLDVTLLGFICGDREVGIYTTATKINRIVVQLVIAVGYVILPRLSYYLKNGDEKGFRDLVHKNFDVLFLFSRKKKEAKSNKTEIYKQAPEEK